MRELLRESNPPFSTPRPTPDIGLGARLVLFEMESGGWTRAGIEGMMPLSKYASSDREMVDAVDLTRALCVVLACSADEEMKGMVVVWKEEPVGEAGLLSPATVDPKSMSSVEYSLPALSRRTWCGEWAEY